MVLTLLYVPNIISCIFQKGSFVSKGERYFIEPVNRHKKNASANFRKFHIVFRHPSEREDFNNGSICGVRGAPYSSQHTIPFCLRVFSKSTRKKKVLFILRGVISSTHKRAKGGSSSFSQFICLDDHLDNAAFT